MPLPICSVCGKKMPPHILDRHMAKQHPQTPKTHIAQDPMKQKSKFDYEAAYYCRLCEADIPQILHEFHMHVKHGI